MLVKFTQEHTHKVRTLLDYHLKGMLDASALENEVALVLQIDGKVPDHDGARHFCYEFNDPNEDVEYWKQFEMFKGLECIKIDAWADNIVDAAERCFNIGTCEPAQYAEDRLKTTSAEQEFTSYLEAA